MFFQAQSRQYKKLRKADADLSMALKTQAGLRLDNNLKTSLKLSLQRPVL